MPPTTVPDRELRGSDFSVGISAQTTKGAINSNPVFTPVRRREGRTSKVISYTEDSTVNNRMQATEQIQDTEDLTAEITASFSKQSVDWLIQAIHADEEVVTETEDDIAATASGFTSASSGFADFELGDGIWVSGFDNDEIDGFYIITAHANGVIGTYPVPPATETAGESVTIETRRSLSADAPTYNAIQTLAVDLSKVGDIDHHTLYDAVLNTMSMEIGETGIVTATGAFVAEAEVPGSAAISGQTYGAALTDRSVTSRKNAQSAVKAFYVDGASATCEVKSLSLEINNQYARDDAAGCDAYYTRGQFQVTGSVNVRSRISDPFQWRDRSWNAERVSIGVRVSHGGGDETYLIVRRAVVTDVTMPDGNNVAANTEASFTAEENLPTGTTIEVYRNWTLA